MHMKYVHIENRQRLPDYIYRFGSTEIKPVSTQSCSAYYTLELHAVAFTEAKKLKRQQKKVSAICPISSRNDMHTINKFLKSQTEKFLQTLLSNVRV